MFNAASKLYFIVAGLAVVAGFAAVIATSDRVAFTNLVFAGLIILGLGIAAFAFVPREPVVVSLDEGGGTRPADTSDLATGSVWPIVGAVAVALVAAGAATEPVFIVFGVVLALIATFAWLGQVWREHPSWTKAMDDRLHDRFIVPIGLPVTVILLIAIGVISLSRLFLAISAGVAPIVGSIVAAVLLAAFYLLSRANVGRSALSALAALAAALVLAAGVAGAIKGEREFHSEHGSGEITVISQDLAFDTSELEFPADEKVELRFVNDDAVPHNVAISKQEGDPPIFKGEIIDKGETTYEIEPLEPGSYFFVCEVHPTLMTGTVNVVEEASDSDGARSGATTTAPSDH